jgi:Tfp pilus assembly protein PilV
VAREKRASGQGGVSLVEVMVTVSLLTVVLSIFFGVLVSMQTTLTKQVDRSRSNDQARLAVEELDREIRSSNVLYDPLYGDACQPDGTPVNCAATDASHGIYAGMSLRTYTQANTPTRAVGGHSGQRCVQWRIQNGQLQRRDWTNDNLLVSAWRVVADHLVNQTGTAPAFSVDPVKRVVTVALLVNQNPSHGSTVRIDSSIEGRNTAYGYPPTVCATVPAY